VPHVAAQGVGCSGKSLAGFVYIGRLPELVEGSRGSCLTIQTRVSKAKFLSGKFKCFAMQMKSTLEALVSIARDWLTRLREMSKPRQFAAPRATNSVHKRACRVSQQRFRLGTSSRKTGMSYKIANFVKILIFFNMFAKRRPSFSILKIWKNLGGFAKRASFTSGIWEKCMHWRVKVCLPAIIFRRRWKVALCSIFESWVLYWKLSFWCFYGMLNQI